MRENLKSLFRDCTLHRFEHTSTNHYNYYFNGSLSYQGYKSLLLRTDLAKGIKFSDHENCISLTERAFNCLFTVNEGEAFNRYAETLRRFPNLQLRKKFLQEILETARKNGNACSQNENEPKEKQERITESEKNAVLDRKTWSDVVAATYDHNLTELKKVNIKQLVIDRLKGLQLANPEQHYEGLLNYLEKNSVITVSFSAEKMPKTLSHFQLLNFYERLKWGNNFSETRDKTDHGLFNFLPGPLKQEFISRKGARPRYGALQILDKNNPLGPTSFFGESFVVLKPVMKQNSLFVAGDSWWHGANFSENKSMPYLKKDYTPCTVRNLEFLLAQCPDETLKDLINRNTGKSLFKLASDYSTEKFNKQGGYLEVLLPAINLFDPNCVDLIYINSESRKIEKEFIEAMDRRGIRIINKRSLPYVQFIQKLKDLIKADNPTEVFQFITSQTQFFNAMGSNQNHLVCLAAKYGAWKTLLQLMNHQEELDHALSMNAENHAGLSPLALAVRAGHAKIINILLNNEATITESVMHELDKKLEDLDLDSFINILPKLAKSDLPISFYMQRIIGKKLHALFSGYQSKYKNLISEQQLEQLALICFNHPTMTAIIFSLILNSQNVEIMRKNIPIINVLNTNPESMNNAFLKAGTVNKSLLWDLLLHIDSHHPKYLKTHFFTRKSLEVRTMLMTLLKERIAGLTDKDGLIQQIFDYKIENSHSHSFFTKHRALSLRSYINEEFLKDPNDKASVLKVFAICKALHARDEAQLKQALNIRRTSFWPFWKPSDLTQSRKLYEQACLEHIKASSVRERICAT